MDIPSFKMYILVNSDLKMGKGKIAAQVGHVVQQATETILTNYYERHREPSNESYGLMYDEYCKWNASGCRKIAVKATTEEMNYVIQNYRNQIKYILDAGYTQVEPNSLTVLAFIPMREDKMTYDISKHKLL